MNRQAYNNDLGFDYEEDQNYSSTKRKPSAAISYPHDKHSSSINKTNGNQAFNNDHKKNKEHFISGAGKPAEEHLTYERRKSRVSDAERIKEKEQEMRAKYLAIINADHIDIKQPLNTKPNNYLQSSKNAQLKSPVSGQSNDHLRKEPTSEFSKPRDRYGLEATNFQSFGPTENSMNADNMDIHTYNNFFQSSSKLKTNKSTKENEKMNINNRQASKKEVARELFEDLNSRLDNISNLDRDYVQKQEDLNNRLKKMQQYYGQNSKVAENKTSGPNDTDYKEYLANLKNQQPRDKVNSSAFGQGSKVYIEQSKLKTLNPDFVYQKPNKNELFRYPDQIDRELPETPRSQDDYDEEEEEDNQYTEGDEDMEQDQQEEDEYEYEEEEGQEDNGEEYFQNEDEVDMDDEEQETSQYLDNDEQEDDQELDQDEDQGALDYQSADNTSEYDYAEDQEEIKGHHNFKPNNKLHSQYIPQKHTTENAIQRLTKSSTKDKPKGYKYQGVYENENHNLGIETQNNYKIVYHQPSRSYAPDSSYDVKSQTIQQGKQTPNMKSRQIYDENQNGRPFSPIYNNFNLDNSYRDDIATNSAGNFAKNKSKEHSLIANPEQNKAQKVQKDYPNNEVIKNLSPKQTKKTDNFMRKEDKLPNKQSNQREIHRSTSRSILGDQDQSRQPNEQLNHNKDSYVPDSQQHVYQTMLSPTTQNQKTTRLADQFGPGWMTQSFQLQDPSQVYPNAMPHNSYLPSYDPSNGNMMYYQNPYGQVPYTPQYQNQAPIHFPMPNVQHQYMIPSMPNYHHPVPAYHPYPQPLPNFAYPIVSQENHVSGWTSRENISPSAGAQNGQTPIIINNNIISPEHKQKEDELIKNNKNGKDQDQMQVRDYVKEQEEFLRKLDEEKKKNRSRLEKERNQSQDPIIKKDHNKVSKANLPELTINPYPVNVREREKSPLQVQSGESISSKGQKETESLSSNEQGNNNPSILKNEAIQKAISNSPLKLENKWKAKDRATQPKEVEQQSATSSNPSGESNYIVVPQAQAFEIVWDDKKQNAEKNMERFKLKREKSLQNNQRGEATEGQKREKTPAKSKEELIKIRKEMMEYKGPNRKKSSAIGSLNNMPDLDNNPHEQNTRSHTPSNIGNVSFEISDVKNKAKSKEPNPELLARLAYGKKTKVDKDQMYKLTTKNYKMLPEIQKRKDEEKKREELRSRLEKVKQLDQKIRDTKYRPPY